MELKGKKGKIYYLDVISLAGLRRKDQLLKLNKDNQVIWLGNIHMFGMD